MSFDNHHYTATTLTEADIVEWSEFCAKCFSYKVNPPSSRYFQNHFFNDPRRDASLIHVMRHVGPKNNEQLTSVSSEIVSSVRIFKREVSLGRKGAVMMAGGIGEVCTHIDHQRKGLAKRLLQIALNNIQEDNAFKMVVSILHASPQLTRVYESSAGYKHVVSHWSVLSFAPPSSKFSDNVEYMDKTQIRIRLAKFPEDTVRLQQIHEDYSQNRLAGCIIRTPEYWNEYLSKEIGDSLFVLTVEESIVAWMSIRTRSERRFQLREYGIVNSTTLEEMELTHTEIFTMLLERAFMQHESSTMTTSTSYSLQDTIELQLPTFVLKELQEPCLYDHNNKTAPWIDFYNPMIYSEDDHGWMYKPLQQTNSTFEKDNQTNIFDIVENGVPHLIWPSDSF